MPKVVSGVENVCIFFLKKTTLSISFLIIMNYNLFRIKAFLSNQSIQWFIDAASALKRIMVSYIRHVIFGPIGTQVEHCCFCKASAHISSGDSRNLRTMKFPELPTSDTDPDSFVFLT